MCLIIFVAIIISFAKARTNLHGSDTEVCWSKIIADSATRNRRVPIIGEFLNEILRLSKLLTTFVNYVKILFQN